MDDKRIGKVGEYPPQETINGKPYTPPPSYEVGLGDGYYCVAGYETMPDCDTIIAELRAKVAKGKGHGRKQSSGANKPDGETIAD